MSADATERTLVEEPALEMLTQHLGWRFVPADELEADRESPTIAVLTRRLAAKLREFNPWLSDSNLARALRAITHPEATSLIEAAEKVHTALVHRIALEQDRGDGYGKRSHDVTFLDFEQPERNEFIVSRQFRVKGSRHSVVADVVCFVNGVPLVVFEGKRPEGQLDEAIKQLLRYQEASTDFHSLGAPALFQAAQILIASRVHEARYATTLTPLRLWAEWKDPWPDDARVLAARLGKHARPERLTAQECLLAGLLHRENLLEIIRTFITFEKSEDSGTVKKICRYQQFRAVRKTAHRILSAPTPRTGGGVIWHTQGSGKSLTMLWLAVTLRRLRPAEKPLLLIVSDRTDLDEQMAGVFAACGFRNPERAHSVASLQRLIREGLGRTVITTIQKFQQRTGPQVLATVDNIFVLVDEAHRTQYGQLAALMRQALPNACFIGFTGTPIDRQDRSTREVFGDYIDRYTIQEAEADQATVPIFYEPRMAELHVEGQSLDRFFDRAFREHTRTEREQIKARYATAEAVAGAPDRIRAIASDLLTHYRERIEPDGFKAQVVACSREAAVKYWECLCELGGPEAAVIITSQLNDEVHLARHRRTKEQEKKLIDQFKSTDSPLKMLIVCDKLLTGFDAPIEQVMYLDKKLANHNLLQAIARVNRPAEGKRNGLVVDYWGVSADLQAALGVSTGLFDAEDVAPALRPLDEQISRIEMARRAALRFFTDCPRDDDEACLERLEEAAERNDFLRAVREFVGQLEMLLPDPRGLAYTDDLKFLGRIAAEARRRFREERFDLRDCGTKARAIIAEHIRARGVTALFAEPVSILSPRFDEHLAALASTRAQASEMAHALTHELNLRADENPVLYRSLLERLQEIIQLARQSRINAAEQLRRQSALRAELRNVGRTARDLGFTNDSALAIYQLLKTPREETSVVREEPPAQRPSSPAEVTTPERDLSNDLLTLIEDLAVIDWMQKDDVQREMRRRLKERLRTAGYPLRELDALATDLLDLSRTRLAR